ncbi:Hypothetical protein D9617_24g017210 [Elsinoe fawcettii]|nr:Hypothetical protein D9617_24g017210 [Elsinoe fawcettii]
MENPDRAPSLCYSGQTSDTEDLPAAWSTDLEMKDCLPASGQIQVETPWASIPLFFGSRFETWLPPNRRIVNLWSPVPLTVKNSSLNNLKCRCKSKDECSMVRILQFLGASPVMKHIRACGRCDKSAGLQAYTLRFGPAISTQFKHFMDLPQDIRFMIFRLVVVNRRQDRVLAMSVASQAEAVRRKRCTGAYGAWLICTHSYTTMSTYQPGNEHSWALRLVSKEISREVTDQLFRDNEVYLRNTTHAVLFFQAWTLSSNSLRCISLTSFDWSYGREFIVFVMGLEGLQQIRLEATHDVSPIMRAAWSMKPWIKQLTANKAAVDHISDVVTFGDCKICHKSMKQLPERRNMCSCNNGYSRLQRKCWVGFNVMLLAQLVTCTIKLPAEARELWEEVDGDMRTRMPA